MNILTLTACFSKTFRTVTWTFFELDEMLTFFTFIIGSLLNAPSAKRMAKDPIPISTRHTTVAPPAITGAPTLPVPLTVPPSVSDPHYHQAMLTAQAQMPTPHMIGPMPRQMAQLNGGKPKIAQMTRSGSGRKQVISWMDAPDDLYFKATESNK